MFIKQSVKINITFNLGRQYDPLLYIVTYAYHNIKGMRITGKGSLENAAADVSINNTERRAQSPYLQIL